MQWDNLQSAVIDEVTAGSGNLVVLARAGAGKTGVLVECANRLQGRGSVLMCAFNTDIQKELQARAPHWATVRTLHSLGLETIRQIEPDVKVDKWRTWADVRAICYGAAKRHQQYRHAALHVPEIVKLTSLCKNMLPTSQEEVMKIARQHRALSPEAERDLGVAGAATLAIMALQKVSKDVGKVSYDDMLYLPAKLNLRPRTYDYIFVDEAQDLNVAQIDLILKMRSPFARIIAVGDDRQAIYKWRGADAQALARFKSELNAKVLPLSITYRCGKKIVDYVKSEMKDRVPDFGARPGAPDGEVKKMTFRDFSGPFGPAVGDFVLARTNLELMQAYHLCLRRKAPAVVAGKDLGRGLITLIESTKAQTIDEMNHELTKRRNELAELATDPEAQEALGELVDQIEAIREIAQDHTRVMTLVNDLEFIFGDDESAVLDDKNKIVITTIHKAKGRERDRVWLLVDGFARTKSGVLANDEEYNVFYVGATRARETLCVVDSSHQRDHYDI